MSQNGTFKILVCVPAYNEAKNISEIVNKSKTMQIELLYTMMVQTGDGSEVAHLPERR